MAFNVQDLFYQWESFGVFEIILPGLLIFALVFGILTATNAFGKNKGVSLMISLVIAAMALRTGLVQVFFTDLFPKLGVGLAVLMTFVILAAAFIPKEHMPGWLIGFGVGGVVIAIIIMISVFNNYGWFDSYFWQQYWGIAVLGIIGIIVIIAIYTMTNKENREPKNITLPIGSWR